MLGNRGLAALSQVPYRDGLVAGAFESGLMDLRDAILHGDRRPAILSGFVEALQRLRTLPPEWDVEEALRTALDSPYVMPYAAVIPTMLVLLREPAFAKAFTLAGRGNGAGLAGLFQSGALQREMGRPLMLDLLRRTVVSGPEIEFVLTQTRRFLLGKAAQGAPPMPAELELSLALAQQCFLNQYAYFTAPDEQALVTQLAGKVGETDHFAIALLASYAPLSSYPWAARLSAPALAPLVAQQIAEPAEERALAEEIERTRPIADPTSQAVRSLYEEAPYPRWAAPFFAPKRDAREIYRIKYGAAADLTLLDQVSAPEILVAGCGTGFNLLVSVAGYQDYRLTAVDLSLNSLAHAARHVRALKLDNIRLLQGDILDLGALPRTFDIVEAIGVLHHMADPLAGWQILADRLKPGGVMQIGLYSTLARAGIEKLRAYAKARGFQPTREGVVAFRREVLSILRQPGHPDHGLIGEARLAANLDFYSISGCRDLVFHPQETSFTIPDLARMIDKLGLRFLGFSFPSPAFLDGYRGRFPDDPAATNLDNWDRFERQNPTLFSRMYIFSVQKPL